MTLIDDNIIYPMDNIDLYITCTCPGLKIKVAGKTAEVDFIYFICERCSQIVVTNLDIALLPKEELKD